MGCEGLSSFEVSLEVGEGGSGGGSSITPPHSKLKNHFTAVTSNGGGVSIIPPHPKLRSYFTVHGHFNHKEQGRGEGGVNLNYASTPHSSLLQS